MIIIVYYLLNKINKNSVIWLLARFKGYEINAKNLIYYIKIMKKENIFAKKCTYIYYDGYKQII